MHAAEDPELAPSHKHMHVGQALVLHQDRMDKDLYLLLVASWGDHTSAAFPAETSPCTASKSGSKSLGAASATSSSACSHTSLVCNLRQQSAHTCAQQHDQQHSASHLLSISMHMAEPAAELQELSLLLSLSFLLCLCFPWPACARHANSRDTKKDERHSKRQNAASMSHA